MPDLHATLLKYDLGHLNIIAELWGIDIESRDADSAAEELCASLLEPEAARETIEILPAEARAAINSLVDANGKMEWGPFARTFGEIREMGPAKRDREKPHLKPSSPVEVLFYRGLLAKTFFDSDRGAQEFAYIPDDLIPLIRREEHEANTDVLGRLAIPAERPFVHPANDYVLDDATTLLAALRMGKPDFKPDPRVHALLNAAKILKKNAPQAEAAKKFLASSRAEALDTLYKAWLDSQTFDELRLIAGLTCEGEWTNFPRETRRIILDLLKVLPREKWWSLPAFLRDLKTKRPDFQRPAGDYDSWFIKRESDGQYLRGFAHWDEVDGAVVKAIIQMLHSLGRVDLAGPEENGAITAFRSADFVGKKKEDEKIGIASNGTITVPRLFSRAVRYQLARFCEWEGEKADEYKYRISAQSLKRANEQGLKADQMLSLLVKHTRGNVPPALVKALKRWEANGAEARVENLSVLRVSRPEVVTELRKSRAGKFLGELLSPTTVVIKDGAIQKVMAALMEMGVMGEAQINE
jgi:hypothetical protein